MKDYVVKVYFHARILCKGVIRALDGAHAVKQVMMYLKRRRRRRRINPDDVDIRVALVVY